MQASPEQADFESLTEDELRLRIARGDYFEDSLRALASKALKKKVRERQFQEKCEAAIRTAALDASNNARRANYIALVALLVSLLAAREQIAIIINLVIALTRS